MDEYIKRGAALDSLCTACEAVPIEDKEICPYRFTGCQEYASIFALPTADVVEVRRGRWNRDGRCDQCGEHAPFWCMASTYYLSNYCPGCGAKMDGGQDDV